MCLDAGAQSVLVMDNPCNDPAPLLPALRHRRGGARPPGGTVDFFEEERTRKMAISGEHIQEWEVHPAFIEADVRINVPIAKHHGLAGLTLGMKNWLGCGRRAARNGCTRRSTPPIVDLAAFFRPQLTVIDGVGS